MIDAHIHLHQYENIDARVEEWQTAGVTKVVAVSNDLYSSYQTLELKERFPDFVAAGIGFHPETKIPVRSDIEEWKRLIQTERDRISFIGEIGLPHYELSHLPSPFDSYTEILREYLHTASEYHFPVTLHAVHDKANIVYELLQEEAPGLAAHFHWLKAPVDVVKKIVDAGYYVSVTPEVCYRERDQKLAEMIPDDQLLVETDGPWLFQGPFSEKETTPLLLPRVLSFLAEKRKMRKEELQQRTTDNTLRLYTWT